MGRIAKSILLSPQCKAGVDWLEDHLPLLKKWHRFEYEQHFERVYQWQRMFSGAWPSFEAAEKAIPAGRAAGFDHLETATFLGQKAGLCASDYPVIYWLRELIRPTTRIFDFGGYNGISYRSYAPLLHYPDGLEWTVYDVPAVVAVAKRKQKERPSTGEKHLHFTDKLEDANNVGIFLASGSLQYCKETLTGLIQSLTTRPTYILLNKLPLTEGPAFVTLQNIGPAVAPYKVFNAAEFTGEIRALGYRTVDTWNNPDFSCYVPFHPDRTVKEFTGMLLCLE
ncbi:MAG: methyltransferase, TIGR04325 family [Acidobacteriaceae bacterium]